MNFYMYKISSEFVSWVKKHLKLNIGAPHDWLIGTRTNVPPSHATNQLRIHTTNYRWAAHVKA